MAFKLLFGFLEIELCNKDRSALDVLRVMRNVAISRPVKSEFAALISKGIWRYFPREQSSGMSVLPFHKFIFCSRAHRFRESGFERELWRSVSCVAVQWLGRLGTAPLASYAIGQKKVLEGLSTANPHETRLHVEIPT